MAISVCCVQLFCSNLVWFALFVFIVWFLQLCFHYLVCPTLFPLFGFHTEQVAAFRLFSRNKSRTRCLAILARPRVWHVRLQVYDFGKSASILFCLEKTSVASLSEEQIGGTTSTPVILLVLLLLLLRFIMFQGPADTSSWYLVLFLQWRINSMIQ